MPSGGHPRSGPPPDPNALRRERDKAEWKHLPASGRDTAPPAWPLTRATAREMKLWAGEWRRPQAIMWEAHGHVLEVALYVRSVKDAERPNAPTSARLLVQRQMDALGLTEAGMRTNRWIIDTADVPADRQWQATGTETPNAKTRLELLR